jgi:hypothetical protein
MPKTDWWGSNNVRLGPPPLAAPEDEAQPGLAQTFECDKQRRHEHEARQHYPADHHQPSFCPERLAQTRGPVQQHRHEDPEALPRRWEGFVKLGWLKRGLPRWITVAEVNDGGREHSI